MVTAQKLSATSGYHAKIKHKNNGPDMGNNSFTPLKTLTLGEGFKASHAALAHGLPGPSFFKMGVQEDSDTWINWQTSFKSQAQLSQRNTTRI